LKKSQNEIKKDLTAKIAKVTNFGVLSI